MRPTQMLNKALEIAQDSYWHISHRFRRITFHGKAEGSERKSFQRRAESSGSAVDVVKKESLTKDDIIIAVMGPTGAGKSSFIQAATGRNGGVGHSLQSCTGEVTAVRMTLADGVKVVLVDTPGFDDTYRSDLDTLELVSRWLKDTYRNDNKLAGILYLHRISDNRMAGTPLKNLDMFQKLCGEDAFKKVILTTTMWQEVDQDIEVRREAELKRNYWAEMISRGSRTARFRNTQPSAWDILNLLTIPRFEERWIQIQYELVDLKKELPATKAGQRLYGFIEQLIEKQKDVFNRMQEELVESSDPEVLAALIKELRELQEERKKAMADMRRLDPSILGKLRRFYNKRSRTIMRVVMRDGAGCHGTPESKRKVRKRKDPNKHRTADNGTLSAVCSCRR